jgi:acetyl esterase/lipase
VRITTVSIVCTTLALGGAIAPARAAAVTSLGVAYVAGAGDLRRLDIYAPVSAHDAPVLVFFHGGGRETGSRKDITQLAEQLSADGILVVSPSYRLRTPATMDVNFAVQAGDAGAAIGWVQHHIAEYGGDPNGIVIGGVSAGAGLVALVATDTHYIADAGGDPRHVSAAFIMSGVLDNRPIPSDYPNPAMWQHDFGLTEDDRYDVSPLKFVAKDTMPILVSTAADENARFTTTGQSFIARMRAVGAPISTYTVPGADHAAEWLQMTTAGSPIQHELINYVHAHAGKNR